MKATLRWFGPKDDSVTLENIRQIPGVVGIVSALQEIPVGDVWQKEAIIERKKIIEEAGLDFMAVESVNIHEEIKLNSPDTPKLIENYKQCIKNLSEVGINTICYNFMPVFDWARSDLAKMLEDGSNVLSYDKNLIEGKTPEEMFNEINSNSKGYSLPGWEAEKLPILKNLFERYKGVTEDDLFENLYNFLSRIIPTAEEYNVKMAIHPDDPPWSIFGLPRITTNEKNIERILNLVDSPSNSLTFCTGSLGSRVDNDLPKMIRKFGNKIHFMHIRNVKIHEAGKFDEASHLSSDGNVDMYEVVKALYDINFKGIYRPDHGRMVWGEVARPGYGLYDRAMGVTYINGLWEAIIKENKNK
ncbi:MAG: mannonate dehydratase [Defluviitaleaceae bacterium]|nr:mannonate dehydratase [Defluviitaleaceae bacterium]